MTLEANGFAETLILMMNDTNNYIEEYERCDDCGQEKNTELSDIYWFYDAWRDHITRCDEIYKCRLKDAWNKLKLRTFSRELFTEVDGF